jgi:ribosomal protein S18 acetylase RimI-like enzyme
MIYTSNELSERQLLDLKGLADVCKQKDGSIPNLYFYVLEEPRALPSNITYYEGERLVGFLSAYFFYDTAVEIAILIHPDYRRKGIARQLVQAIRPLVEVNQIAKLIFTTPSERNAGWLEGLGFQFQHSEYHMIRDDPNPLLIPQNDLKFDSATIRDIPTLSALDEVCFPNKQPESVARFESVLNDRKYKVIIALLNNTRIGKAHIRWDENAVTFSDIAILPPYQGKGYGSALIAYCINLALSEGKNKMSLDVETHNQRALDLYKKLGFITENACDYWTIPLHQLLPSKFATL